MRLPIGYSNFEEIIEKKFDYIDKTLWIKALLDDDTAKISVITRPRRFGKTLNLSMLQHFFAARVYGKDTQDLFTGLNITKFPECMQHQGKFPVIFISFKDIKESTYEAALRSVAQLMSRVYREHSEVLGYEEQQEDTIQLILKEQADAALLKSALFNLTEVLHRYYGIKPWLLIDEYDTPIQSSYLHGYYQEMIEFMRGAFGLALKDNSYLERAVITGILRVAKESLFSGLNNLKVYSVLNSKYSEYFGFTEHEVDAILQKSQLSQQTLEIKQWYNGYQFGGTTIYNPWSIVNCIDEQGTLKPYWVNTSGNDLIKSILKKSPLQFKAEFEALMQGGTTQQLIDENMVFGDLQNNHGVAAWGLMLMSGYLTSVMYEQQRNGILCQLRVPNQEVNNLYRTIVELWLADAHGLMWYSQFIAALTSGHIEQFKEGLGKIMLEIASYHDFAKEPEAFFHGLLLGFIASLQESHVIRSNRESGLGRYDIMLIPRDSMQLGIVIELKAKAANDSTSLDTLATQALQQIDQKHYLAEFHAHHIKRMLKIAIAFEGKTFALRYARDPQSGAV